MLSKMAYAKKMRKDTQKEGGKEESKERVSIWLYLLTTNTHF